MQLNKLTQEEIHKLATPIWSSLILAQSHQCKAYT